MKEVLLLGVVYSEKTEPARGQEYRDRVRCDSLEKLGYSVRTLDNKHRDDDISSGRHCTANFTDPRRMLKSIHSKWNQTSFDHIILDYFFSPVSAKASLSWLRLDLTQQLIGRLGQRTLD